MTSHDDIRRICSRLPGSVEGQERFGFGVETKGKVRGFCWSWAERVHPKKPKEINDSVLAIRTPNLVAKDMFLQLGDPKYFTEPHYQNYPAILVRLDDVDPGEIEDVLVEGWKSVASKQLLAAFGT